MRVRLDIFQLKICIKLLDGTNTESNNTISLTDHVFTSRYTGALCRAERTAITEWRLFSSRRRYKKNIARYL